MDVLLYYFCCVSVMHLFVLLTVYFVNFGTIYLNHHRYREETSHTNTTMKYFQQHSHLAQTHKNSGPDLGQIHQIFMLIGWLLFANLGLWCRYFTYSRFGVHLHSLFMCVAIFMAWASGFLAIVVFGLSHMSRLHVGLGITVLVLMGIVAGGGIATESLRVVNKIKPNFVVLVSKIHKIGGWTLLCIVWLQLLTTLKHGKFALALLVNLFSFGVFLIVKFKIRKQMESVSLSRTDQSESQLTQHLKIVKTTNELAQFQRDYFIFEDKIYDVNNVLSNHPGGWELIRSIKGREVDQYLYGTQHLPGFPEASTINPHYANSIKLADAPLAILHNPCPYTHMHDTNAAHIEQLTKPCRSQKLFVVYLMSKLKNFQFKGYTQLSQLGKYWAIGAHKKTRLYSVVNFLHLKNLQFMIKFTNGQYLWQRIKVINYNNTVHQIVSKQDDQIQPTVPLFIKKYDNGRFTKMFLSGQFTSEIKMSRPRGRGLFLHEVSPGTLLILAAGTGLNPFCDLIDLMFKQQLLAQSHALSAQIIKLAPLLKQQTLKIFRLVLLISVFEIEQIHPITIFQLNYLSQRNRVQVNIVSKKTQPSTFAFTSISKQNSVGFIANTIAQLGQQIQQIYICGPPQYSNDMMQVMKSNNVQPYRYRIL